MAMEALHATIQEAKSKNLFKGVQQDRLPTRCDLDDREIYLDSTSFSFCEGDLETARHLFIECPIVMDIWENSRVWWDLDAYPKDLTNMLKWVDICNFNNQVKGCLDVVVHMETKVLWRYRNWLCFDAKPPRKDTLCDEIKVISHSLILPWNKKYYK
ncbi:RNA-directed DNA polymerase, eukaryota, Reverse transcriptase zinc-binding domain protein [Artemisia annua]|uniref:RNA-directed DNA polymerase, eukaryota, Reverse transcriptase zinc-binding domain protein n=1 Tax=Artemisia annua TaxID=35608 RepID=A0A2U1M0V2_ARTAN|nr:RNA-directed DNA polymerase, eukaryota, Reverse transcriptase zinc-binding domain protein [Artemisia annua]